jgi:hypothetical protein
MRGAAGKEGEVTQAIPIKVSKQYLSDESQYKSIQSLSPYGQQALERITGEPVDLRNEVFSLSPEAVDAEIIDIQQGLKTVMDELMTLSAKHADGVYSDNRSLMADFEERENLHARKEVLRLRLAKLEKAKQALVAKR